MLVLGVDAGGTSTRAVLATADGQCLGYGRGGSGNPTSSGVPLALDGVLRAIGHALQTGGADLSDVTVMAMAIAGHDSRGGASSWIDMVWVKNILIGSRMKNQVGQITNWGSTCS